MSKKKFTPPKLAIDYDCLEKIDGCESVILTDEVLKEFKLQVDKTKIDVFDDINFISIFE